ncbi:MAG: sigma 54-interacting transcriptional regulator [bacterium]
MTGSLFEICKSVFAAADIDKLLPFLLDLVIKETNAERCRIVLYDAKSEVLFNRGRKKGATEYDDSDTHVSRKIADLVKTTNTVFVSSNAMIDSRLADTVNDYQTIIQQGLLSVACAPLQDQGRPFGVVYIDNRDREALFSKKTGELLNDLAELMSEALHKSLKRSLRQRQETEHLRHHIQRLTEEVDRLKGYGEIIGTSPAMKKVYEFIDRVKDLDINVLVTGENGTGKELVARTLHRKSRRGTKNFIAVDCSAIPENMLESELFGHEKGAFTGADKMKRGRVEEADGGTLFLDEIGNINLTVQAKLLRFLDTKKFYRLGAPQERLADARLVFATNKSLRDLIKEGKFMEDLYYRLTTGVQLHLPALRERGEDILLIAEMLLGRYCEEFNKSATGLGTEACACLLRYSYPGNIRELKKIVANAIIFAEGSTIQPHDLPEELRCTAAVSDEGGSRISFKLPKTAENDFYTKYLPDDFKDRNFIWGLRPELENMDPADANSLHHALHDTLILSVGRASGVPMTVAAKAVSTAFERNFMIARLLETKGKVTEAALRSHVDKKTFIEKMKLHEIKKEWYVD